MGVLGLTTFAREHERTLGKVTKRVLNASPESLVIDGWSFIYHLTHSVQLPWVFGGEYLLFSQAVEGVVQSFLDVGFHLHFVFDGALQPSKFATKIKRCIQNSVVPAQLFFRTSNNARSAPRFLTENHIQPPLYYLATLEALNKFRERSDNVTIYMADDDADKFAVELAGKLGAFCLSNDSDYIILNCEGYKGYIQFNDLRWDVPPLAFTSNTPLVLSSPTPSSDGGSSGMLDFDDLGFKTVTKPKSRRKKKQIQVESVLGLVPPENFTALSFTSFHPVDLAAELKLPISMLPLVASLIGNDFSEQLASSGPSSWLGGTTSSSIPNRFFFESRLPASHRITRVADVLHSILNPKKARLASGSGGAVNLTGLELISNAVEKLLIRPDLVGGREREKLVDSVVEGVLRYAIIPSSGPEDDGSLMVCDLHSADECPLYLLDAVLEDPGPELGKEEDENELDLNTEIVSKRESDRERHQQRVQIRNAYITAYRQSHLLPNILNIVGSGTYWASGMLEDPDKESCERSVGCGVRKFVYAVLGESMGIGVALEREEEEEGRGEEEEEEEEEDQDELIDVVEEQTDEEEHEKESEGEGEREQLYSDRLRESLERAKKRAEKQKVTFADDEYEAQVLDSPSGPKKGLNEGNAEMSTALIVREYVRRGVRVTDVPVEVEGLGSITSLLGGVTQQQAFPQLLPSPERLTFLLHAIGSHIPPLVSTNDGLLADLKLHVVCIRWVVKTMGERSNPEERWSRREARCLLASLISSPAAGVHQADSSTRELETKETLGLTISTSQLQANQQTDPDSPVELQNRNIQLTAQFMAALSNIIAFIQVMLLTKELPVSVLRFSGKRFHRLLQNTSLPSAGKGIGLDKEFCLETKEEEELFERCWKVCEEGMENFWGIERGKGKGKRVQRQARKQQQDQATNGGSQAKASVAPVTVLKATKEVGRKSRPGGSLFSLLGDMDDEA